MEKECECYEEEVQPYRKTDYKPIIYSVMPLKLIKTCRKLPILKQTLILFICSHYYMFCMSDHWCLQQWVNYSRSTCLLLCVLIVYIFMYNFVSYVMFMNFFQFFFQVGMGGNNRAQDKRTHVCQSHFWWMCMGPTTRS